MCRGGGILALFNGFDIGSDAVQLMRDADALWTV